MLKPSSEPVVLARGFLLVIATLLTISAEVFALPDLRVASGVLGMVFLGTVAHHVCWSRQIFIAIGVLVSLYAIVFEADGWGMVRSALSSGGYVLSFFVGLSTLRTAAMSSPSIQECGEYLSTRTPGKRYAALTLGGHLFSLVLNYGSISLLGALVEKADGGDGLTLKNPVRVRRMLLAIQRGFVATLCWSPLTFSMAMGTAVVEGSSWNGVVGYGLGAALLLMLSGWALDTIFKPRLTHAPQLATPVGSLSSIRPLIILLVAIFSAVGVLHFSSGLRIVTVVMIIVPLISLGWIALQNQNANARDGRSLSSVLLSRSKGYIGTELDSYRGEMVLLFIAAYVGKIGGAIAAPLVTAHLIDLSVLPVWLILLGIVLGLPLVGQLGMHPILAVSMLGPLLPAPEVMDVSPDLVLATICLGWAFSGATSPFTATVLLVALYGKVKSTTVGLVWNRGFVALGGLVGIAYLLTLADKWPS